jgi:hypothetical protein
MSPSPAHRLVASLPPARPEANAEAIIQVAMMAEFAHFVAAAVLAAVIVDASTIPRP